MTIKSTTALFTLTPLISGICLYLLFRDYNIQLFDWILFKDFKEYASILRIDKSHLPSWIIYNLPDGLWIFSFTSLMCYMWKDEISYLSIIWILFPLVFAFCFEFGQKFNFIKGTYDKYDLITYIISNILSILFNIKFNKHLIFNLLQNEKD